MPSRNITWPAKGPGSLLILAVLSIFSGAPQAAPPIEIINAFVPASTGGTFTDDALDPSITLTIPPGALNKDANLTVKVKVKANPPPAGANQTGASPAFDIKLKKTGCGGGEIALSQPMTMAFAASPAPVHPQLGEIAVRVDKQWLRMKANFYRSSLNTVVALTKRTEGKFRVMHRTLQARTGPAVERGRDLYFSETWTSESFWGGVFGLHEVLNNVDPFTAAGLGAQIDITRVPQPIVDVLLGNDFALKQAALADPATTQALLKADAVLGLRGLFDDPADPNRLTSVGLTCAL